MHAGTCVVQWQLCSYRQSSWTKLVHPIGYRGGCTLHVDAMSYLVHCVLGLYAGCHGVYIISVHCQHLACSLANCLYCSVFPFTKNAEVPFAAVCQLISTDHGMASQWSTLARLLGLSHSQIDVVRLECHNRPQPCQQSAAKC